MTQMPKTAVLLMAYGSAPSLDDEAVRGYLTHILQFYRRAAPTDEEVQHLKSRYEAVGGSPLYPITERIVTGTQHALDLAFPGEFAVVMGMKHSPPFIEDAAREIAELGVERGIAVALAPFRSRLSTDGYYQLIREMNDELPNPLGWQFAPDWHLHPLFLHLWRGRVQDALRAFDDEPALVFTNHSLPARITQWDDPYPRQFEATASALAELCGAANWTTAYQSAGGGNVPWLGPALPDVLTAQIAAGHRSVLLVPIGFVMDHLEVLYDLDIDAQQMGRELDVKLARTRMPNDDPLLVGMLADVVRKIWTGEPVVEEVGVTRGER